MMLLMVLTGEEADDEAMESRLELTRDDEVEVRRRKEVRSVEGAKRAAMEWKREDCILLVGWGSMGGAGGITLGSRMVGESEGCYVKAYSRGAGGI